MSWTVKKTFECDKCKAVSEGHDGGTIGFTAFCFFWKKDICRACREQFNDWYFHGGTVTKLTKETPDDRSH